MDSLILRAATKYLLPVILMFSLFLVIRGHNEPGGGFVGGLLAAGAVALYAMAADVNAAYRVLPAHPQTLIGTGLLLSAGSGVVPLIRQQPFFTAQWGHFRIPMTGDLEIGTPLLFDLGVFIVVVGVALMILLSLAEE